jgi:hypothetical protein
MIGNITDTDCDKTLLKELVDLSSSWEANSRLAS